MSAVFRRLDWQTIVTLLDHLALTMYTSEGLPADDYEDRHELYFDLSDIQVALQNREVCRTCKCMEGLHRTYTKICPVQPGPECGPQLLSNTFVR